MNLRDRMNSDLQDSKQKEIKPMSENEQSSSTNTMQKSKQPSKEMELLEKQSLALKQVTEERDNLLKEGRPIDQKQIQKLSSEIQELRFLIAELRTELSETQKSNQLLSTNNRILVKQNDELRNEQGLLLRNEQKKLQEELTTVQDQVANDKKEYERKVAKLNRECDEEIAKANERADKIANQCAKDNATASKARNEAEGYRSEQLRLLREQQSEIDKLADKKISNEKERLKLAKSNEVNLIKSNYQKKITEYKNYYRGEYAAKETWHILVFSFCICWLIIQALSSNYFRKNVMEFGSWINAFVTETWNIIAEWTPGAANIAHNIPNEIVYTIAYWLVYGIVGILLIAICYGLPLVGIVCGSYAYLSSKYFDRANRWIMIGTGIMLVALSSEMFYTPPMNILLIWLCIQVAVPLLRYIIIPFNCFSIDKFQNMSEDEKRYFYSNIMMVVVVIAGFFFVIWTMKSCSADLARMSH